ncbi:MAG TPA: hypothetical protein VMF66_05365, partial [Candidatus Acidoferrum sp.]|nr:hypothetical protein [Candidatus Acidoferrum sp.]
MISNESDHDSKSESAGITRRKLMKIAASAGATAILSADALNAFGAASDLVLEPAAARRIPPANTPAEWTGHNTNLAKYYRASGYPAYDPHPRYLGELQGSWYEIGKQYGQRAGDLIRMVYEGWYREILPIQGTPDVIAAYLREQTSYYEFLVPEALEMMHGIADGSARDLASSAFPRELSHFDKILMINSYFGLMGKPPSSETTELAPADKDTHCCSGAVILGPATRDGKTIHVSSEDQHFFPQEYLV